MAIVVTDNCENCRFTECVTVCPVACFHGDDRMLYIDASVCIECRACIPVCPVHAIRDAEELSAADRLHWIGLNAERVGTLPVVEEHQQPLPMAQSRRAKLGY